MKVGRKTKCFKEQNFLGEFSLYKLSQKYKKLGVTNDL